MRDADLEFRLRTLGETIRALRIERGHSIGDVAQGTDLSPSFLSLVENGRSDISTGRLFRVARFLGVGLGDLLDMDGPEDVTIVRSDDLRPVDVTGGGLRMLPVITGDDIAMAPVICEYAVGAHLHCVPKVAGGEHFIFAVRGEIELTRQSGEAFVLRAGDCAYIRSSRASEVRNVGGESATAVWVSCPPVFPGGTSADGGGRARPG